MDVKNKVVLVTGGTRGIGLASALAYGRAGARTIITHRWGSADLAGVRRQFAEADAPEPLIVEANAADDEDTVRLLDEIAAHHRGVDVFISNVAMALRTGSVDEYKKRSLFTSIEYTAWPMWAYSQQIRDRFGARPRYIIGLSSDGPDSFFAYYDFVAMSKAVLETMCRYMNARLMDEGVRVNVVRSRMVKTEAMTETFGRAFEEMIAERGFDDCYITPEEVAKVVFALGSGLLDAIGGQVVMADRGFSFIDNLMGIYEREGKRSGGTK